MSNQTIAEAKIRLAFLKECMEALVNVKQRETAFAKLSDEDSYIFQMEYEGYFMMEEEYNHE